MKKSILFILTCLITSTIIAQTLEVPPVDNSSYAGKAMFGYQGWFGHPDDDSPRPHYWHWGNLDQIGTDPLEVEMYPDMRELCASERYETAYTLPSGRNAEVFSAGNKQTVIRHMKWVRDYNTDGVFVQRFISEYGDQVVMAFRDCTTVAVMEGCETYDRVFSIMYDGIANRVEDIKTDWMHMVDDLGITSSDAYLNHEGRPLVALWGYTVRSDATVDQLVELIDWFHNTAEPKYQASIKLGLNDNWFNKDQVWLDAFDKVEVISPWSVGRYNNQAGYDSYVSNQIIPGMNWCNTHDVLYVPVLFPGFSWYNLKEGGTKNQIRRNGGDFFWLQAYGAINKNVESLYFAMLDEVDEATAFFKTAENSEQAPAQEYWLNLDADGENLPSDWYLRCAGQATQMLRGDIAKTSSLGTPDEGVMTIRPSKNDGCTLTFIFPDFEGQSTIEISLDGGLTYPYSIDDDLGEYHLGGLGEGTFDIFVRHPGSAAVPMGVSCLSGCYAVSIDESSNNTRESFVNIFPNPVSSNLFIEGSDGTYQVELFDVLGRKHRSLSFQGTSTSIDVSDLPGSIYFIKVEDGSNKYIQKIYKTR